MAQALEKIFLQKVAQMPQEEVELLPPPPKGKARKPGAAPAAGKSENKMRNTAYKTDRILNNAFCTYLQDSLTCHWEWSAFS